MASLFNIEYLGDILSERVGLSVTAVIGLIVITFLSFTWIRFWKRKDGQMPRCSILTPPDKGSGSRTGTDGGMHSACIPPGVAWKGYTKLVVVFMRDDLLKQWTIDGQAVNKHTILHYANIWNRRGGGKIPLFVEANPGEPAQIRVSFNNSGIRNSYLGKDALSQGIDPSKGTMNLDLSHHSDQYKKHVIIHEFGHALGLAHEHQRSDFWKCIKAYINEKKMIEGLKINKEKFDNDWGVLSSNKGHHTEYDPNSVMHYGFDVEWLNPPYSDVTNVETDYKDGILTEKVKNALLGVHKRGNFSLADKPSELDILLLKKEYEETGTTGGGDGNGVHVIEQPKTDDGTNSGPQVKKSEAPVPRVAADEGAVTKNGASEEPPAALKTDDSESVPKQKEAVKESEVVFEQEYDVEVKDTYLIQMKWTEDDQVKVVRIYKESMNEWREIGGILGINRATLKSYNNKSPDVCIRNVLGEWLENASGLPHSDKYPKTWRGLIDLLNDSGLTEVAKEVHKALLQQKQPRNAAARGSQPAVQQPSIQDGRVMAGGPPALVNGQNGGQDGRVMAGGPPAPANGQNGGQGSDLTLKDLDRVYNAVIGARSKWYHIGLALEIEPDDLDSIKDDNRGSPEKCLTDVLKKFLQQVSPKPSWHRLATAMASNGVGRGDIAAELRKQYW